MQDHHTSSPTVTRIVTVLGVASLIGLAVFGVLLLRSYYAPPIYGDEEYIQFESGSDCYVFCELKLAIFLGDGGAEEVFDRLGGGVNVSVNDFGGISSLYKNGVSVVVFSHERGKTTIKFFDGKGEMVLSDRGTKLALADGREFTLDGRTPLWLRCKSDGTIVELEELPEGFVEFFESPPPDPGLIGSVKSWPDAFRK